MTEKLNIKKKKRDNETALTIESRSFFLVMITPKLGVGVSKSSLLLINSVR